MTVPNVKLNNGTEIPILGLGTWQSKPSEVYDAVKHAIDVGYRHFDTAYIYGNEFEIGQALKEKIDEGAVRRKEIYITTKLWSTHHQPELVLPTLKQQLRSLQLDYVDLYLMHFPQAFREGDEVIPRENGKTLLSDVDYVITWNEMETCVSEGLTKSIGVSNFNMDQIDRLLEDSSVKPVTNQIELHPFLTQKNLVSFCKARDISITAYSPLGSPDHPSVGPEIPRPLNHELVAEIAKTNHKSPAQVLIRYHIESGNIVIPKSVNDQRIEENFNVFDFSLNREELKKLDNLNTDFRFCTFDFAEDGNYYPFEK